MTTGKRGTLKHLTKTRQQGDLRQKGRQKLTVLSLCQILGLRTLLALAISFGAPAVRGRQGPSEYQVKAAFLFNFAKFIEWPESSFLSDDAPFSICVLGEDPFGSALDDLRGKSIGHRPVAVWRIKNAEAGLRCQVLFVSASEESHLPEIFASLRGSNALVVGQTPGFAASGGAIEFTLDGKHVHFTINPDAMRRAGLRASSQLLALAKIVHDGPNAGSG